MQKRSSVHNLVEGCTEHTLSGTDVNGRRTNTVKGDSPALVMKISFTPSYQPVSQLSKAVDQPMGCGLRKCPMSHQYGPESLLLGATAPLLRERGQGNLRCYLHDHREDKKWDGKSTSALAA